MARSIKPNGLALKHPEPKPGEYLSIPAHVGHFNPREFPSSARLEGLFRRKGIKELRELDGVALQDLRNFGNCGPRTIAELVDLVRQITDGKYAGPDPPLAPTNVAALLRELDETIADLPTREKDILLLRVGATKDGRFWTLRKVGNKFHLTRERVRQIMELILPYVRKAGGPGLAAQLRAIVAICTDRVCPLTPQLLAQWLPPGKTPGTYPP